MTVTTHRARKDLTFAILFGALAISAFAQPPAASETTPEQTQKSPSNLPPKDVLPRIAVADEERGAISILASDLDLHLIPSDARAEAHATLTVRNTSASPIGRIPLQISGSLRWQNVSIAKAGGLVSVPFTQAPIATDADHTGYAQELIVTPERPLAPGASVTLSTFYAGEIRQSAARFELLGASAGHALEADWDAIAPTSDLSATSLRGFGNVLWYPVAAPAAILGDGNKLFEVIAHQRALNVTASMRLRLTVEYLGEPPDSVIFNGEAQPLSRTSDLEDQLIDDTHGLAVATYPEASIGFRLPSLFLTAQHAVATEGQLLSVFTPEPGNIPPYALAASRVGTMLAEWLGPMPRTSLLLLDHPGSSFEDAAFLVAPLSSAAKPELIAPELVRGLAHARFHLSAPASLWLDQGVPEFMNLLWTEHMAGRNAALSELQRVSVPIALAEPDFTATPAAVGQPLTHATAEIFLCLKSAAVLWQLREILGDDVFREALKTFRHSLSLNPALDQDSSAFQRSIERTSKLDLAWFFNDWIYRDRGLPDLTIVQVNPRLLPARPGKNAGYLIAVEVRNDGDAVADVPVTVRSGSLSSSERLRIPANSSASTRILFESSPDTVQVNDGSTPELRSGVHLVHIAPQPQP